MRSQFYFFTFFWVSNSWLKRIYGRIIFYIPKNIHSWLKSFLLAVPSFFFPVQAPPNVHGMNNPSHQGGSQFEVINSFTWSITWTDQVVFIIIFFSQARLNPTPLPIIINSSHSPASRHLFLNQWSATFQVEIRFGKVDFFKAHCNFRLDAYQSKWNDNAI